MITAKDNDIMGCHFLGGEGGSIDFKKDTIDIRSVSNRQLVRRELEACVSIYQDR